MKLDQYFKETGIMKSFFANKVGSTSQAINGWLSKRTTPKLDMIFKIQKETGGKVKPEDWLN